VRIKIKKKKTFVADRFIVQLKKIKYNNANCQQGCILLLSGVFKIIYGCNNFADVEYILLEATM